MMTVKETNEYFIKSKEREIELMERLVILTSGIQREMYIKEIEKDYKFIKKIKEKL